MISSDKARKTSLRVMHFLESGGLYGAENVVLNLSREMLKTSEYVPVIGCIVQDAFEQVAIYDKALSCGIEAHKIVINNKKFPLDIISFLFMMRRINIDLVHSHGYKASIIAFFAMMLLRIPILPTCHLWFFGTGSPLRFRTMIAIEIFLYRFLKIITVVSLSIKQTLVQRGVPSDRIHIIKNGINLDDFQPVDEGERKRIREKLGLKIGTPVIMNLGRLTEQKAHCNIVHAARIMKSRELEFVVLIIGEGELREALSQQICEHGVETEVKLLGFRDDARMLLQIADIFLLPSLDEGLPMAMLEAMASRVPVIATGVGDIPELFDSAEIGIQIPVNDVHAIAQAIEELLINRESNREYAENAHATILKYYSSNAMFCNYSILYKNVKLGYTAVNF